VAGDESPASVLDASALLAHLNEERGAEVVREAMQAGAAISVINWTEVLTKLAERGEDPELAAAELRAAGLIGATVSVEPVTDADCIAVARLRSATKAKGLSLADRACLALADRLGVPAMTADRTWSEVDVAAQVHLIR
jgi:PIN domain nuclease of toxin-antitoxin system